jgi:hypothetical protein
VTDAQGAFGYVVYVREDQFQRAVDALAHERRPAGESTS